MPNNISYGVLESSLETPLKAMGFFMADSFGLDDTRVISICYDFVSRWMTGTKRFRDGLILRGQALRIAADMKFSMRFGSRYPGGNPRYEV